MPTPTAAATPPAPTPSGSTSLYEVLQGQYLSVGGRWPMKPTTDSPVTSAWVPPLFYGSNGGELNTFTASVTQGFFEGDMWRTDMQQEDFAERTIFMLGGVTMAGSSLESGEDLTRSEDPDFPFDYKYTAGELHIGSILRGGAFKDRFHVIGALNFGTTNLVDPYSCESSALLGGCDEATRRVNVLLMQGAESDAWIGKRITGDLTPGNRGALDIREHAFREDDDWDTVPADVGFIFGESTFAWLDNKRGDYCSHLASDVVVPSFPPHLGGFVGSAAGIRSGVLAGTVKDSWINAGNAHAFVGFLGAGLGALGSSEGHFCEDERVGSILRKWVGIEIANGISQLQDCCEQSIPFEGHPYIFHPQTPCAFGGTEALFAGAADPALAAVATSTERFAGIVRGDSVFGDGFNDGVEVTGYDTDVAHFRDVIRLNPRTAPPAFDPRLPPPDRVGLLYFDAVRNTLRVSVALSPETAPEDWKDEQVVWVDLAMATERIDPIRDVQPSATSSKSTLSSATRSDVESAMVRAGQKAESGESRFLKGAMEVIVAGGGLGTDGSAPRAVTLITSNIGTEKPRVFWKREASGKYGEGERGWTEVPADGLQAPSELGADHSVVSASIDLGLEGAGGQRLSHGQRLHFMAVNPSDGRMAMAVWRFES